LCFAAAALFCPSAHAEESEPETTIELTQEEKDFIRRHPVVYLGVDPTFVPYEFFDSDGKYKALRRIISI
jgi:hypothetical protein